MTSDAKADLHRYLRAGREALLWKLDGLGEYDIRRPLVPTGTNLLGLVKHLAMVEWGYFGLAFGRPADDVPPWFARTDPNADMWATAEESREHVVGLYRRMCAHADETIDACEAEASGHVPWWPEGHRDVTLHRLLVHVVAETNRHAGHADIVRELIDGTAGRQPDNTNLPAGDAQWWSGYRERVEAAAQQFR